MRYLASIAMVLVFACGGPNNVGNEGEVVGGPCTTNGDCANVCQGGGDFPGGTCTLFCNTDDDCPPDTACIGKDNVGLCLLTCSVPADCRPGYSCEGKSNHGRLGDSLVCIAD